MTAPASSRRRPVFVLPVLAILVHLGPIPAAHAWGPTGHRVIAAVAARHLPPAAAAELAELLDGAGLPRVSTWADDYRERQEGGETRPWHWVDLEDGEAPESRRHRPEGDLLDAIERFSGILADPRAPREERAEAVRYLIHFVADLHQPLHVGRPGDRGGNEVVVLWFGEASNLHSVWDSGIIGAWALSYTEIVDFLDAPTAEQLAAWRASDPPQWARESQQARSRVYAIGGGDLGRAYQVRNQAYVEERLLQAGVRLASLLESLLGEAKAKAADSAGEAREP